MSFILWYWWRIALGHLLTLHSYAARTAAYGTAPANITARFCFCCSLTAARVWRPRRWFSPPSWSQSPSQPSSGPSTYFSVTVVDPGHAATSSAHTVCPGRTITVLNACATTKKCARLSPCQNNNHHGISSYMEILCRCYLIYYVQLYVL